MTSRTGGLVAIVGTTLPDTTNLLYETYCRESITEDRKFLFTVKDVYRSICLRNEEEAEIYWNIFKLACIDFGVDSDYVKSQYFVSFDLEGNSVLKIKRLNDIGVFKEPTVYGGKRYSVGSIDTARQHDYCAYSSGHIYEEYDSSIDDLSYTTTIENFDCLNVKEIKNREILDVDTLTNRLISLCIRDNLDMIVYESTANQIEKAYVLAKALMVRGLKTKVIPIDYSSRNKKAIYDKAETEILSGNVLLPPLSRTREDEWFKELLYEFEAVQKVIKEGTVKYITPPKIHDDFISSVFQLVYLPTLCRKNKIAELSKTLKYPIKMYKGEEKKNRLQHFK